MGTHCAKCREVATLFCNTCNEAPKYEAPSENTHYCSGECQQADFDRHKRVCQTLKDRKSFYRAASVLQDMFFVYLEMTFGKAIDKIDKRDGKVFIVYKRWYGDGVAGLRPFPAHLCKDKEEEKSVLAHMTCCDSVAWMHEVVGYFLKGLAKDVKETTVVTKNARLEMVSVRKRGAREVEDKNEFLHELFKVVLSSGEVYALDLSAAQEGFYEPVTPWSDYVEGRIDTANHSSKVSFNVLGNLEDTLKSRLANGGFEGKEEGRIHMNVWASQTLKNATIGWEYLSGLKVETLLQLDSQSFEEEKKNLVESVGVLLQENLRIWQNACKDELINHA